MKWLALLFLSGCASMLQPIPGMVAVGDCKRGVAYSYKGELICDFGETPSVSRKLEPNDNAGSACVFCDGWRF